MTDIDVSAVLEAEIFPPVEFADGDGILCVSEFLSVPMLMNAYWNGIFPWPWDESCVPWAAPAYRGVIPLDEFHVPKSFVREMKKLPFELRIDTVFEEVMDQCAVQLRNGEPGTWITSVMKSAYRDFHAAGWAHSFEVWNRESGKLAGGLYGISIGKIFCGESMFHLESGASKFALVKLAEILKKCGCTLLDTQQVTNATAPFGAREITRDEYMALLEEHRGLPIPAHTLRTALQSCANKAG
ncbi:MAG: leucyl/phenylalanyl-tRNA--protein transferase [Victivallales bacterium]|nr:leucyl/phenylalanyl-tRNA--protein transferase [Victivallales bacterium]